MTLRTGILTILFAFATVTYAQDSIPRKVDYGFLAGPNFTNYTQITSSKNLGFELGILANWKVGSGFTLDLAPTISFEDYMEEQASGVSGRRDVTLLNVSSHIGYTPFKTGIKPTLYAGTRFQYDLSETPRYNEPTRLCLSAGFGATKKLRYFTFAPRFVISMNENTQHYTLQLILRG